MEKRILELIEYAVKDGVVTAKERVAIYNAAAEYDYTEEEVDLILDARLAEVQNSVPVQKKQSLGQVTHCPACGALVNSGQLKCSECGYEFKGIGPNSFVKEFQNQLEYVLSKEYSNRAKRKAEAQFIKNYPLPLTKEDSIEMLNYLRSSIQSSNKNAHNYLHYYKAILQRIKTLGKGDQNLLCLVAEFEGVAKAADKRILVKNVIKWGAILMICAVEIVLIMPKVSNDENKCRKVVTKLIVSNELTKARDLLYTYPDESYKDVNDVYDVYDALVRAAIQNGNINLAKEVVDHFDSRGGTNAVKRPYFNYLIDQGEYDTAEKYIPYESWHHIDYYDYMEQCVVDMCKKGQYAEAKQFMKKKAVYFEKHGASNYTPATVIKNMNTIIKSYTE